MSSVSNGGIRRWEKGRYTLRVRRLQAKGHVFGQSDLCHPMEVMPKMCLFLESIFRRRIPFSSYRPNWPKLSKSSPKFWFWEKRFVNEKVSRFSYETIYAHNDSRISATFCGNLWSGNDQTGAQYSWQKIILVGPYSRAPGAIALKIL